MRILVALGGNALLRRGESAETPTQRRNVEAAAAALAEIAAEHELVITHGNGPQAGLLALQNAAYEASVDPCPLDVLGAESEGMVGYMLELALRNSLPGRDLVTVFTEVVVAADDPALASPSKPIGPVYSPPEAEWLARERGWTMESRDSGAQRLVPSPEPRAIVELRSLRTLIDAGTLVICADGGIPVAVDGDGAMRGVEAVVDKDLTASLLARRLDADLFVMLTDVDAVRLDWGADEGRVIATATPAELRRHRFEAGTMGPKVEAACRFAEATGARAAIGELADAVAIARGEAGTQIGEDGAWRRRGPIPV